MHPNIPQAFPATPLLLHSSVRQGHHVDQLTPWFGRQSQGHGLASEPRREWMVAGVLWSWWLGKGVSMHEDVHTIIRIIISHVDVYNCDKPDFYMVYQVGDGCVKFLLGFAGCFLVSRCLLRDFWVVFRACEVLPTVSLITSIPFTREWC